MRRITGLLTSAIVIVVDLSIPASAGGKQSRADCKQRIFQKDELFACFMSKDGTFIFSREQPVGNGDFTGGDSITQEGYSCKCQLRRKYDVICAGSDVAVIASTDRRGRWISGEVFEPPMQDKFLVRRGALADCPGG